jgi:hypothetical protein
MEILCRWLGWSILPGGLKNTLWLKAPFIIKKTSGK